MNKKEARQDAAPHVELGGPAYRRAPRWIAFQSESEIATC